MNKYKTQYKIPEGYEKELLILLAEEAAEIQQRACKALRFGIDEIQKDQPYNNSQRLGHEIGDLVEVITRCKQAGIVDDKSINSGIEHKAKQLETYMQFDGVFHNYDQWLSKLQEEIEKQTGVSRDQHQQVFNIKDNAWFEMYEDGLTPDEALEAELQSRM